MANLFSAQSIVRYDGLIAYRIFNLPSVSYSLPSTSFSRQELATGVQPQHAALTVVFDPTSHRGMGKRHLYFKQGYLVPKSKRMIVPVMAEMIVFPLLRKMVAETMIVLLVHRLVL
jgi:hypothetical protein